jgi:dTDP-glucose pyrophosphorylase
MSVTSPPQGVILAAGKGTRIRPFSEQLPKPLLPLLDRPLLEWQIEAMRGLGVEEILVVIGHLGHSIVQALGDGHRLGVRLRYVEQEQILGIAHAVGQLEPHVTGPFLLFLGDIFFETRDLGSMLEQLRDGADGVLAVKEEDDPALLRRNFTVETGPDGFVRRVIEKPRHPQTNLKGCGLYLFAPAIFDSIRRTPRTALRDEYELTDSIQIFINDGYRVAAARVIERDLNLSVPSDLLDLNLHLMEAAGHDAYVSESAVVHEGAVLRRSVIMADAHVPARAELEECVVLPGERIRAGVFRRTVFHSGAELACD